MTMSAIRYHDSRDYYDRVRFLQAERLERLLTIASSYEGGNTEVQYILRNLGLHLTP